ncbi:MAG TPA: hypothetical protein VFJ58_06045 [Armatimonadota bacterium]|nr:hypothetical protein [Armatimonadota bacterium]
MLEPGSALRNALAAVWCILGGAGYFLAQFAALNGNPVHVMDPVEVRLRTIYLAFLALFALLALFDL